MFFQIHRLVVQRRVTSWPAAAVAILLALMAVFTTDAARPDNPPPGDSVGSIEGAAIAVTGPMTVETVNGQILTVLRSGSDVRVKSGSARIKLAEGGQIAICGPAHLSVLKSGKALTIALDTGTIHAHIEHEPLLTMYTPQIQAQPVAIGDGAQDTVVGFDATRRDVYSHEPWRTASRTTADRTERAGASRRRCFFGQRADRFASHRCQRTMFVRIAGRRCSASTAGGQPDGDGRGSAAQGRGC